MVQLVSWIIAASAPAEAGMLGPWLDDAPVDVSDTGPVPEELPPADPPSCKALKNGVQMPERPDLYAIWDPNRAWGSSYLVDTLVSAAQTVAWQLPDADPIAVGDLSQKGGGALHGHITHNVGVDADIGLYTADHRQPSAFFFEDVRPSMLDTEATWLLIRALLETERIDFILLDESLIRQLRAYLLREGILDQTAIDRIFPPTNTPNAFQTDGIVRHATGHRNHMHVRVRCE